MDKLKDITIIIVRKILKPNQKCAILYSFHENNFEVNEVLYQIKRYLGEIGIVGTNISEEIQLGDDIANFFNLYFQSIDFALVLLYKKIPANLAYEIGLLEGLNKPYYIIYIGKLNDTNFTPLSKFRYLHINNVNDMGNFKQMFLKIISKHYNSSIIIQKQQEKASTNKGIVTDINYYVNKKESHNLEFKSNFPHKPKIIGKIISAFSNLEGGNILFGVSENGKGDNIKIGIINEFEIRDNVMNLLDLMEPKPVIKMITIMDENKKILLLNVEKAKKKIKFLDKYYIRDLNSDITREIGEFELHYEEQDINYWIEKGEYELNHSNFVSAKDNFKKVKQLNPNYPEIKEKIQLSEQLIKFEDLLKNDLRILKSKIIKKIKINEEDLPRLLQEWSKYLSFQEKDAHIISENLLKRKYMIQNLPTNELLELLSNLDFFPKLKTREKILDFLLKLPFDKFEKIEEILDKNNNRKFFIFLNPKYDNNKKVNLWKHSSYLQESLINKESTILLKSIKEIYIEDLIFHKFSFIQKNTSVIKEIWDYQKSKTKYIQEAKIERISIYLVRDEILLVQSKSFLDAKKTINYIFNGEEFLKFEFFEKFIQNILDSESAITNLRLFSLKDFESINFTNIQTDFRESELFKKSILKYEPESLTLTKNIKFPSNFQKNFEELDKKISLKIHFQKGFIFFLSRIRTNLMIKTIYDLIINTKEFNNDIKKTINFYGKKLIR